MKAVLATIFNVKGIYGKMARHLLFWIIIILFYIFSATTHESFRETVETTMFKLPLLILAAYTFNYWQVPFFLKKKKYILFGLSMLVMIFILTVLFRIMGYLHLDEYCESGPYPLLSLQDFPFYMLSFHFPALLMYFYKTNKEQSLERDKLYALEKEKIATELKYLKAQLNPHFLFNTLNNLYSYVITKSPKAPEMVLQLSEILDYILYRSQREFLALKEELHTIKNYIALEQIKYGERLKVTLKEDIITEEQHITPLLLLSIVENAFKHGVSGTIQTSEVKITVNTSQSELVFKVWNTKTTHKSVSKTDTYKSGIGLDNISRQLNLIYPERHTLKIEENETSFELTLTLTID